VRAWVTCLDTWLCDKAAGNLVIDRVRQQRGRENTTSGGEVQIKNPDEARASFLFAGEVKIVHLAGDRDFKISRSRVSRKKGSLLSAFK